MYRCFNIYLIVSSDEATVRGRIQGISRTENQLKGTRTKSSFRKPNNVSQDKNGPIFSFTVNNYTVCERKLFNETEQWNLIVIVVSKIDNFIRRNAIRNTWASEQRKMNVLVLFHVGLSKDISVNEQVRKEAELYNDIIQVELIDDYKVLTLKSISMLQWLTDYCSNSKFYLKSDDDMYINVQNTVQEFIQRQEERFFLCHVFEKAPPIRDQFSKWYVSEDEFSNHFYPTYCSGTAYGFSSSILSDLYRSAVHTKLFRMEDVFISGIVAENINTRHIHSWGFSFTKRPPTGCAFQNVSSGHEVTVKQMYMIYAQLNNKEIDCETKQNVYLLKVERED
jgi:hypothetical protein